MQNQQAKFSLPKGVTYLNGAYMSPLLKSVEQAGISGLRKKRDPLHVTTEDFFADSDLVRKEFSKLINNRDPGRIAIIPSVSYGMANVARNVQLRPGDKILVAADQFPSNIYPWQRLTRETFSLLQVIRSPETFRSRGARWNEQILEAIDARTRIVALGHVHWADGTRFELEQIRERTFEVGALLIIDGTQSVGAMPFDLQKIQPDALVCGGYKWLMGPYSIGLAYYGERFDQGAPIEENWINRRNSENFAGLVNYQDEYQPGALRYEVGEHSNFILVPMLLAAIRQINAWKPSNIQAYCRKISRQAVQTLVTKGFWVEEESNRGYHLFGIRFPQGYSIGGIQKKMKERKIAVSFRGDFMRVSPHVYNSQKDFDRLLEVLQ